MVLLIVIILLAALIGLFAFDLGWNNVVVQERNDLVFEERNKKYGAFVIRQEYSRILILALACAVGFATVVTVVPMELAVAVAVLRSMARLRVLAVLALMGYV